MLVALDPGTRHAGLAIFHGGKLVQAEDLLTSYATVDEMVFELSEVLALANLYEATLVSEWPRKYPHRSAAHSDVEKLRQVVKRIEDGFEWHRTYRVGPQTWGSTTPKPIRAARTGARLTEAEKREVLWDELGPDGKDAIGLGLWVLDRPEKFGETRNTVFY